MTKESNGLVHVNAYVKEDGTEVREHYRNAPDGGISQQQLLETEEQPADNSEEQSSAPSTQDWSLIPRIQIEDYPYIDEESNQESTNQEYEMYNKVLNGKIKYYDYPIPKEEQEEVEEAIDTIKREIETIKNTDNSSVSQPSSTNDRQKDADVKIKENLNKIKKVNLKITQAEDKSLDALIESTNQIEYQQRYNSYLKIRDLNRKNRDSIARLEYAAKKNNYEMLNNELENYKSNYFDVVMRNKINRPLANITSLIQKNPSVRSIINNSLIPQSTKAITDIGMYIYNLSKQNSCFDAKEMWKASSHDFKFSSKYVKKNGSLVYKINDLPSTEIKDIVRKKLLSQNMETEEVIGMIFKSKSHLSKEIATSPEIRKLVKKHKHELLTRKVVKGESTLFKNSKNLALALGHADIVYMYIDDNGDLCQLVLDTYDMNKNDPRIIVKIPVIAQEKGYIRKYYSLIVVKTPRSIWQEWLNE